MAKKIHVVIVDDDLDNRELTREDFTRIDWIEKIRIVEDPHSLLDYLETLSRESDYPALILVDYQLSEMNGEELFHLLKKRSAYKNIQVAFYSSNLDKTIRKRLDALGVQYFPRPFNILQGEELAKEIKEVALKNEMIEI